MSATRWYNLWPTGPMRIGKHAEDLDRTRAFPGADSLFGAICWGIRQLHGSSELERWLEPFIGGSPPLLLTSALPVMRLGEETIQLVPMPNRRPQFDPERLSDRKLLRRSPFIDYRLLDWLGGGSAAEPARLGQALVPESVATNLEKALALSAQRGRQLSAAPPWAEGSDRPRVTVDRLSGASNLFSAGYTFFADRPAIRAGMSLGFIVRDESAWPAVESSLALLGETGIGGERSLGNGGFDLEPSVGGLPLAESPAGMCLAPCAPSAAQLAAGVLQPSAEGAGYKLAERSGWIGSDDWHGYRGKTVSMVAEGSYLNAAIPGPIGFLADVTPEAEPGERHRVYRYGFGCFLDEGLGA